MIFDPVFLIVRAQSGVFFVSDAALDFQVSRF